MAVPSIQQLSDAFDAFRTFLGTITWPTSGDTVVPDVRFEADNQERPSGKVAKWPLAIIRVSGGRPDDENGLKYWQFDVTVELRIKNTVALGESDLFGKIDSETDKARKRGLFDVMSRIANQAGYVTVNDTAEAKSFFECVDCGEFGRGKDYARVTLSYVANLLIAD